MRVRLKPLRGRRQWCGWHPRSSRMKHKWKWRLSCYMKLVKLGCLIMSWGDSPLSTNKVGFVIQTHLLVKAKARGTWKKEGWYGSRVGEGRFEMCELNVLTGAFSWSERLVYLDMMSKVTVLENLDFPASAVQRRLAAFLKCSSKPVSILVDYQDVCFWCKLVFLTGSLTECH